jgi:hypothetical protein
LLLLVLAGIGAFFYFGGSAEGPEVGRPEAPSADEATSGLTQFFGWFGDTVSGWSQTTWTVLLIFALVGVGMWIFRRVPLLVWLVIAVVALVVAVVN